jgi:hypothetical protein
MIDLRLTTNSKYPTVQLDHKTTNNAYYLVLATAEADYLISE